MNKEYDGVEVEINDEQNELLDQVIAKAIDFAIETELVDFSTEVYFINGAKMSLKIKLDLDEED